MKYAITTLDGTKLVQRTFPTERAAQNKLRMLTERGIIAGIPVKIAALDNPAPPVPARPAGEHTPGQLLSWYLDAVLAALPKSESCNLDPHMDARSALGKLRGFEDRAPALLADNERLRAIVQMCSHFISRAHGGEGMTEDERWALLADADAECRAALTQGGGK